MPYKLPISKIQAPKEILYPDLLQEILRTAEELKTGQYRTQAKILDQRKQFSLLIIEGLAQVARTSSWSFFKTDDPLVLLCLSISSKGFASGALKDYSYAAGRDVIDALNHLGYIDVRLGYYVGSQNFPTEIWPSKTLVDRLSECAYAWRPRSVSELSQIQLKNYDSAARKGYLVSYSSTAKTRAMKRNLLRINKALLGSAICLNVEDMLLWWIRFLMCRPEYRRQHDVQEQPRMLDFSRVELRRTFLRKSFEKGGRFHGGWWQSIPSRFRPYIAINGEPVVELDYSAMHIRLMYAEFGDPIPEGDLYDLGLDSTDPERARGIIKVAANSLINSDTRGFILPKSDLEFLGMSQPDLVARLCEKHPRLKQIAYKSRGLNYQFTESQIAERVMLDLLDQGIICLPVHDSFLVPLRYETQLKAAMEKAHLEITGIGAIIKPPELPKTEFEPVCYPSGELDITYLSNLLTTSSSLQYMAGYHSRVG